MSDSSNLHVTHQAQVNDPFSDQQFGTETYAQLVPKGPKYWLVLLLFALGLTLANYAWRTQWVPAQPIMWQAYSSFLARQCISLKRPILVAYFPADPPPSPTQELPQTLEDSTSSASLAIGSIENQNQAMAWEETLNQVDIPKIRTKFHLRSARAFRLDEVTDANDLSWLFPDGSPTQPTLLCWNPESKIPRHAIGLEQFSPNLVYQWLSENGQSNAPASD